MNTVINYITTSGLYVLFGLWSFFQVLEYKYYTRIEQYDTIVENIKICKEKYVDLLVKITQLENRVDELEDILVEHNLDGEDLDEEEEEDLEEEEGEDLEEEEGEDLEEEKLSLDAEALQKSELETETELELEQMANEDVITNVVQNEIEEKELNEVIETVAESLEDEMVDISEETYPIKNQVQNKKGWLKTILFL